MEKKYGKRSSTLFNRNFKYDWENIKTEKENNQAKKEYRRLIKKYQDIYNSDKKRFHF